MEAITISVTLGNEVRMSKRGEKSRKRKVLCIDDGRNEEGGVKCCGRILWVEL